MKIELKSLRNTEDDKTAPLWSAQGHVSKSGRKIFKIQKASKRARTQTHTLPKTTFPLARTRNIQRS